MQSMMFRDIPNGRCFRITEKELICSRYVHDEGVFLKMGNSHAVRVQNGMSQKTIIPGLKVQCVLLPGTIKLENQ